VGDSTASKVYSRWRGPAEIIAVKSAYGYLVELDGARYHMHANKLRKFHVRVDEVLLEPRADYSQTANVDTSAIVYEHDSDFGPIEVIQPPAKGSDKPRELLSSEKLIQLR